jgi:long-chain fatty acid transport protein
MENWVFGYDVRYINYRDAKPFDAKGFAPDGSLRGLGWKDLFVVTAGAQYRMSERISVRAGYSYNNSTQDGDVAFFNVGAPTILQHGGYAGLSYHVNDHLIASLAYAHAFKAAVEGPFVLPFGPVPGTAVRSTASADAFVLGFTVRY